MINSHDIYTVLSAMVPLYIAMILAYTSVRYWNIFTPDQCAGINRFVAVFAVPLLSFHFISTNNPYTMNLKFIAADTLQKIVTFVVLLLWTKFSKNGGLDWLITIFSLSTLPNSLVMGIPLLVAMYGDHCRSLMVQVVVLQCIVWYTLLLFLFEFRAAKVLISDRFPDTAGSIASVRVESDVISLDEFECLEADGILASDGKLRVTLRKSDSNRSRRFCTSPRPSNFSGVEIYSRSSSASCSQTLRESGFDPADFYAMTGVQGYAKRNSSFSASASSPRTLNFGESAAAGRLSRSRTLQMIQSNTMPMYHGNELNMYIWGSNKAPGVETDHRSGSTKFQLADRSANEVRLSVPETRDGPIGLQKAGSNGHAIGLPGNNVPEYGTGGQMPPAGVMTRLILIMVWRKLVRNPNTYSSLIGLIWSLIHFRWNIEMPLIIDKSIAILSDAGLGMAMFSLGLFMALQPSLIPCGKVRATYAMCARFITGPAVMAAASFILGIRGELLRVAIVQAALPQGIVPFVFAKEYNVHPKILSTAVIFGMLIALPITLSYYVLLGL